mgnify:CR=1 FL=1
MKLITLYLPEPYLRALDKLVNAKFYPNRAEAIRLFVRDGIISETTKTVENDFPHEVERKVSQCTYRSKRHHICHKNRPLSPCDFYPHQLLSECPKMRGAQDKP